MKKNLILCFSLALLSFWATAQQRKQLTFFTDNVINGLITNGNFDVQLSQGEKTGVTIEIAPELEEKLEVSITEDKSVRISYKGPAKDKPLCKIVVSHLNYLSVTGSSVISKGECESQEGFNLLCAAGAYVAYMKVKCERAVLDIKGSAKIEECTINATYNVEIINNDASNVALILNTKDLTLNSSGLSLLTLSGKAAVSTKITSAGTATVDILALESPKINASALGMSKIKANVTGEAEVTCGGTASFRYTGSGKINSSTKGVKPL